MERVRCALTVVALSHKAQKYKPGEITVRASDRIAYSRCNLVSEGLSQLRLVAGPGWSTTPGRCRTVYCTVVYYSRLCELCGAWRPGTPDILNSF